MVTFSITLLLSSAICIVHVKYNAGVVMVAGHTGRYLIATLIITSLTLLSQVIFQSAVSVLSQQSEDEILSNCKSFALSV